MSQRKAPRPSVTLVCCSCGKDFIVPAAREETARFCSNDCYNKKRSHDGMVWGIGGSGSHRCGARSRITILDCFICQRAVTVHGKAVSIASRFGVCCSAGCNKERVKRRRKEYWLENYETIYKPAARRTTAKRRAMKLNVINEDVDPTLVAKRDGNKCYLCGRRVNNRYRFPDPKSPSMDHVIPLSRGGNHTYANIRLTHLKCNLSKNNRPQNEQLAMC